METSHYIRSIKYLLFKRSHTIKTFNFKLLTLNFWRSQTGVSLIESLMVVAIMAVVVFLMANLPNAMGLINKSKHLSIAREIATKQIEDKRSINYANLVNDTTPITASLDSRINLLPNGSGSIQVENCPVQICTNSEHIKQVAVTINWKDNNKNQTISLKTFIGEGGLNQ